MGSRPAVGVLAIALASSGILGIVRSETAPARQLELADGGVWLAASALGSVVLLDGATPGTTPNTLEAVGSPGDGLVVHQIDADALVVNQRTGGVSRIDGALQRSSDPVSFFETGSDEVASVALAVGPEAVWAYSTSTALARRIDPVSLQALDEAITTVEPASSAAVGPDGSLWLTDDAAGVVSRIDAEDEQGSWPVESESGDRLTVSRVGSRMVVVDHQRSRIALADAGGLGDWVDCPGVSSSSIVSRSGADTTVLAFATDGVATITMFDPTTESCRTSAPVGDGTEPYGIPVEANGEVFIPELTARRVAIVRADTGELVSTTDPLDTPGQFDLVTSDGLVFYNDPESAAAGLIVRGDVVSQPKYLDGGNGIAVLGAQTTPEPTDPIEQPLEEWSCTTEQTQAVAGTPVTFEVRGPSAMQSVAWEFSDGSSGQGNPVQASFAAAGTISAVASIATEGGTQNATCNTILIVNSQSEIELRARFSMSTASPVAGTSVTFTDKSEGSPTTWAWSFQGATPATSSASSPTVKFPAEGQYTVRLTVGNGISEASDTRTVTVKPDSGLAPMVAIGVADTVAVGDSVLIRAQTTQGAPQTFAWTLDPGQAAQQTRSGETISYAWTTAGSHRIDLLATDNAGRTATATATITVVAEPKPSIDAPATITIDAPAITVTGNVDVPLSSIKTWKWTSNIHGTLTGRTQNLAVSQSQATTANNKLTLTLEVTTTDGNVRTTPPLDIAITAKAEEFTAAIVLQAPASMTRSPDASPLTTTFFSIQGETLDKCEVESISWTITFLDDNRVVQQGSLGFRDFGIGIRWGPSSAGTYRIAVTGTPVQKQNCTVTPASAEIRLIFTITMPNVIGMTWSEASSVISGAGLQTTSFNIVSGCRAGVVTSTSPAAGAEIEPNGFVTPSVSSICPVPNVVGLQLDPALQQLQSLGFRVSGDFAVPRIGCSNGFAPVIVQSQSPTGGELPSGSTVTLTHSGYRCQ